MHDHDQVSFEESLRREVGEFIVVIIKSGVDCCKHKGVLCKVEKNFLILINNNLKTEIPLHSIVAVKKKIKNKSGKR